MTQNTYGLLLQTENVYGSEYLVARIVKREGEHHAPRNCSDGLFIECDRPKHLERFRLDGLSMRGFVSTGDNPQLIGFEPSYYNVYSIDERQARRMVLTLKTINDRIRKDSAYDAADCLVSFCSALRLTFIVECRDKNQRSSYDDNEWHFMSIGDGRNRYRDMIAAMLKAREAA